jgi:hypothetical protein
LLAFFFSQKLNAGRKEEKINLQLKKVDHDNNNERVVVATSRKRAKFELHPTLKKHWPSAPAQYRRQHIPQTHSLGSLAPRAPLPSLSRGEDDPTITPGSNLTLASNFP